MFTYTARNQLETYTLPDTGSGPAVESWIYDESKRLKEVNRPGGKVITFDYQLAKDRLEKITPWDHQALSPSFGGRSSS